MDEIIAIDDGVPACVARLSKMGADRDPGPNDSQTQERVVWFQTAGLTGYRMSVNGGTYTWQVFGGKMEIGGFSLLCVRFLGKAFLAFGIRMRVFLYAAGFEWNDENALVFEHGWVLLNDESTLLL